MRSAFPEDITSKKLLIFPQRLREMAEGELKDMELFFSTLQTPFTAFESEAYKTSVVGGF